MNQSKFFSSLSLICLLLVGKINACCHVSSLQIGGNYTHVDLKMDGHSTFHGNLGGIQGSYEYKPRNGIYGGLRVAWKQGTTENRCADRNFVYVDVQERIGYSYSPFCNPWAVTLFSGFGYRHLGHRLKQCDESSIKFDYNEFYIPLGLLSEYSFCSNWVLGLNVTWMPQVYPTVKISPLKGARWILKNTIGNVLVELPVTYYFSCDKRYSLVLKPFYEHWQDGRSTAKTSHSQKLDLPRNSYSFWGVELNFTYAF